MTGSRASDTAIQEIQQEALDGKFDVLLVFMFDRLGRIDDETPFIVEWFVKPGIEVWSAKEGELSSLR
jgi:DNA invertase Pin-like site-specific DNA recombinase